MSNQNSATDMAMIADDLYLEETFTDRRVGTIRRLTPVDGEGNPDPSRPVEHVGQAQIMTQMGALPLSFPLEGETLAEAAESFAAAAEIAVEQAAKELEELRRQSASSIVVPGAGGQGQGGGGFGGLQLP
ncbi:MAG: hypothetical protein J4A00_00800 [Gammaproteobacteria bacterium]|nr:hypothetical protein [Gammaproteobacteria bacterium]